MNLGTVKLDSETERKFTAALNQFPAVVQDRVVKRVMRPYLVEEMRMIRAINGKRLPKRDAKAKIKIFPSGVAWGAVAYKVGYKASKKDNGASRGRAQRAVYDLDGTGWRSHFAELGTHSWGGGLRKPESRKGLGWKRGLTHRGRGKYIRGTHASELARRAMMPKFRMMLLDELNRLIRANNPVFGPPQFKYVQEF